MHTYRIVLELAIEDNAAFDAHPPERRLKEVRWDAERVKAPLPSLGGSRWSVLSVEEST